MHKKDAVISDSINKSVHTNLSDGEVERLMTEYIINQDINGISRCLSNGCNINALKFYDGRSCADFAVTGGYHESFKFLIEQGANVHEKTGLALTYLNSVARLLMNLYCLMLKS